MHAPRLAPVFHSNLKPLWYPPPHFLSNVVHERSVVHAANFAGSDSCLVLRPGCVIPSLHQEAIRNGEQRVRVAVEHQAIDVLHERICHGLKGDLAATLAGGLQFVPVDAEFRRATSFELFDDECREVACSLLLAAEHLV